MSDLIERQAVKEQMIKYGFRAPDMTVTEFVEYLPSVTQKTGRWIFNGYYECSECGKTTYNDTYKYCPNCGAKMEVEE